MPTDLITLKLDRSFLKEIDATAKRAQYHSRTEFIRDALRTKLREIDLQEKRRQVEALRGSLKHYNTTDEDLHRIRERVAREVSEELHK